jgi:hypothetical protein
MFKQVAAHVTFDHGSHGMPAIVDKQIARRVNGNQDKHQRAHPIDLVERVGHISFQHVP